MRARLFASSLIALTLAMPCGADILRFRLPAYLAGEDGCSPGATPIDSIVAVELWRMEGRNLLLERTRAPQVTPGEEETLAVFPGEGQVTYYVTTRRAYSRSSCPGPLLTFNGSAGIGDPATARGPWLGVPRPNPIRSVMAIAVCIPTPGALSLDVLDVAGRRVAQPLSGNQTAGVHMALWDARGSAPGVYLVRARVRGWQATQRVLVLR